MLWGRYSYLHLKTRKPRLRDIKGLAQGGTSISVSSSLIPVPMSCYFLSLLVTIPTSFTSFEKGMEKSKEVSNVYVSMLLCNLCSLHLWRIKLALAQRISFPRQKRSEHTVLESLQSLWYWESYLLQWSD